MTTSSEPVVVLVRPRNESAVFSVDERFRTLLTELAERFPGIAFVSIPFLYDATEDSQTVNTLRQIESPLLIISSFSERASRGLITFLEPHSPEIRFAQVEVFSVEAIAIPITEYLHSVDFNRRDSFEPVFIEETFVPRWYPVIDREACCRCLECVNFCLFGVYGIGEDDCPVVESPQSCRDGCPACSRVCPGGAIIFPLYPDAAISGQLDANTVRVQIHATTTTQQMEAIRDNYLASEQRGTTGDELDKLVEESDSF